MRAEANGRKIKSALIAVLAVFLVVNTASGKYSGVTGEYLFIDLRALGGDRSEAYSINDNGQIVGRAWIEPYYGHACLFDPSGSGNNIDLGTLGGDQSYALSINENGQIVGRARTSSSGSLDHACLCDPSGAGNNTDLGTLGGDSSRANSINDNGEIVGAADHACLFDPSGSGDNTDLGTLGGSLSGAVCINNYGQIVGGARTISGDPHACLFDASGAGENTDLRTLGGGYSTAFSINDTGQIVGWADTSSGGRYACLFDPSGASDNTGLGTLGGDHSEAYSINDNGQIVGWSYTASDDMHACLFDPSGQNVDLNSLLPEGSGWELQVAYEINNNGWIVGVGINPYGTRRAYLLRPKYSGGTGEPNDPYRIATAADLNDMGNYVEDFNKCFIVVNDINMAGFTYTTALIGPDINDSSGGFQGTAFTGIFDGNDCSISNLSIDTAGADNDFLGLFGRIEEPGQIKNLGIQDVSITGGDNSYLLGGLCGVTTGTISKCYATGSVTGGNGLGGLCGYNYDSILNCYSIGSVTGADDSLQIGGLCGGIFSGTISNCYATGSVSGGDYSEMVGGLCGYNSRSTISNCYEAGSASGGSNVGGLVGYDDSGSYTYSFWNIETSPEVNGIGNISDPNVIGKTTAEMQAESTFTDYGWDFVGEVTNGTEDIWRMCWDGGWYPRLAWQFYPWADFLCPDRVDLKDLSYLAGRWAQTDCAENNNCDGADLDYSGVVDCKDLKILTNLWLKGRPAPGELAVPAGVDFADYAVLAGRWLHQQCWLTHNCHAADLDFSGAVDWADLRIFCDHWLEGY